MLTKKLKLSFVILILTSFIIIPQPSLASASNGTIDGTYKYAWSENMGWLNFNTSSGAVTVTDTALTGYAWSSEYGWINLAPSGSGVINDGEGTLSGSAWGENAGWINFSGVTIDNDGYFLGYASGTVSGQVSFNCSNTNSCSASDFKVRTDWRKTSLRGGGSAVIINTTPPRGPTDVNGNSLPLSFNINNSSNSTKSQEVILKFNAGDNVEYIAISENPTFAGVDRMTYQPSLNWTLSKDDGQKTLYVKFYTKSGIASDAVSQTITLKQDKTTITQPATTNQPLDDKKATTKSTTSNTGFADGNLIKAIGQPDVYYVQWGKLRPIINEEIFSAYNFKWTDIIEVSQSVLNTYFYAFPLTMPTTESKQKSSKPSSPPAEIPKDIAPAVSQQTGIGQYNPLITTKTPTTGTIPLEKSTEESISTTTDKIASQTGFGQYGKTTKEKNIIKFTNDLQVGDRNNEVKQLQQWLNQNGFIITESGPGSLDNETNFYGNLTKLAVIKLQNKYKQQILAPSGLTSGNGRFGPATRNFVNNLKSNLNIPPPTQTPPSEEAQIKTSQPSQEILDKKTEANLPSAKFSYGLSLGMRSDDVKRLQILLASLSDIYPEGEITGNFGELTEAAVKRFQLKYNLTTVDHPAYGYVGPATRAKLLEIFGK